MAARKRILLLAAGVLGLAGAGDYLVFFRGPGESAGPRRPAARLRRLRNVHPAVGYVAEARCASAMPTSRRSAPTTP